MYVFALFCDNILRIFNIADISLHVKLIMRMFLPYFCVRYILLLNLTAYSQYPSIFSPIHFKCELPEKLTLDGFLV